MGRKLQITKTPVTGTTDKVTMVRDFLAENYEIQVNEFDTSKSFVTSKVKKYDKSISFQDIYLHLIEEGINVGTNILKMILTSPNYSRTFNPVLEYFQDLQGKYRGTSQIDILALHITARDFGDKGGDFYQERKNYIIKKWIVATAACALGKRPNDVALGLVAAKEGLGKTFLLDFLIPADLKEYYKQSDKDERLFNMAEDFTRNFVINFDEFVGITRSKAEIFKKVMSAQKLPVKRPREEFSILQTRIASATFTTNRTPELGGFLTLDMGLRRFGVIDISDIDHAYSRLIDVDQLWAEAVMLLEQDFDYVFNADDYADFEAYNSRFMHQSSSSTLIRLYYDLPETEAEGEWLMASEILKELQTNKKVQASMGLVSEVTIGLALSAQGFIKKGIKDKMVGTRYKYLVKSKF